MTFLEPGEELTMTLVPDLPLRSLSQLGTRLLWAGFLEKAPPSYPCPTLCRSYSIQGLVYLPTTTTSITAPQHLPSQPG